MTIWVKAETKARYEDLAHQALDAYRPTAAAVSASVTDTGQLQAIIHTELARLTADVTATVTAIVTKTLVGQLQELAQDAISSAISATVTDTETVTPPGGTGALPVTAPSTATVTATETAAETDTETATRPIRNRRRTPEPPATAPENVPVAEAVPPRRRGGRPPSPERQQILALLVAHPEGLSAEELRVYVKPTKPIGDTLQGMRKTGVLRTRDDGKPLRYVLASLPQP